MSSPTIIDQLSQLDLSVIVTKVFSYVREHILLFVGLYYLIVTIYKQFAPYPKIDYGNVKDIESPKDFDKAIGKVCPIEVLNDPSKSYSDLISVVDFYAVWCPPCRAAAPVYAKLSIEYANAAFFKVNADHARAIVTAENIKAFPTFKVYKSGVCVGTIQGWSETKLRAMIEEAMNKKKE